MIPTTTADPDGRCLDCGARTAEGFRRCHRCYAAFAAARAGRPLPPILETPEPAAEPWSFCGACGSLAGRHVNRCAEVRR